MWRTGITAGAGAVARLLAPPSAPPKLQACLVKGDHHPALRQKLADLLFRVQALRRSHHGLARGLRNLGFHES
jgi:hypothetical protein